MRTELAALTILALAAGAAAQEKTSGEKAAAPAVEAPATGEVRDAPRPSIRVLQQPSDISSFYRSGESPLGPWAGLPNDPAYRIADFYRSHPGRATPGRPTGGRPSGRTATARRGPFPSGPTDGRSGRTPGTSSWPCRSSHPIGPISGAFVGY